ncbi:6-carboxytetrahydropterin synthase QueD [bacterium]|nr:6-carboxytetrahydropterin synthase QueD [bacterium]
MYNAQVRLHFDAAHFLRGYKGKCEQLHGQRFKVAVTIETQRLDDIGMSVDFGIVKSALKEVIDPLDHNNLNTIHPFDTINPSSENLASYIFNRIKSKLSPIRLKRVKVWESPDSWASFSEK